MDRAMVKLTIKKRLFDKTDTEEDLTMFDELKKAFPEIYANQQYALERISAKDCGNFNANDKLSFLRDIPSDTGDKGNN